MIILLAFTEYFKLWPYVYSITCQSVQLKLFQYIIHNFESDVI